MAICKRNTCYISVGRSKFYYCRKLREEKHENRKESLLSILIRESVDSCVSIISKKKATSSKNIDKFGQDDGTRYEEFRRDEYSFDETK